MAVLLSPVGGVAAQFFDSNGSPLSGGLISTYAAGTNTPQATYTTSAGTIQHSNPIVLDAAGRVPTGEIWLVDGQSYKFVIQDRNAVLVGTYDNIVGINSNFVNYLNQQEIQTATAGQTVFTLTGMTYNPGTNSLSVFVDGVNQYGPGAQYAYVETSDTTITFLNGLHVGALVKFTTTQIQNPSVTDSSEISYKAPYNNSVAESVQTKLAQIISVTDFGAVGDGVTDDTNAIKAAALALAQIATDASFLLPRPGGGTNNFNIKSYGELYFPEGSYVVSDTIVLPAYSRIVGAHATITGTDTTKPIFSLPAFETHVEGICFAKGKEALYYNSGNIDTSIASVTNCEFNANYGYSINTTGCYSTKFNVWNCKFISTNGAMYDECDETTIRDSWITALAPNITYFVNSNGNMSLYDIAAIPDIGDVAYATSTYWLQNGNTITRIGGYIVAEKFRFGAEAAGIAIARNYAKAAVPGRIYSGLIFKDCGMWAGNSIIRCEETPNFVITRDSDLFPGGTPRVTFDESASSMTATPYIELDIYEVAEDSEAIPPSGNYIYGIESQSAANILNTNSVFSGATTSGQGGAGGSSTTTTQSGIYPPLIQVSFGTVGALPQLYQTFNYSTSVTAGWHTASILIKADKDIILTLALGVGQGAQKQFHVPGDNVFHVISFPALVVGTSASFAFAVYNVQDNTTLTWGCPCVVKGHRTFAPATYITTNAPNPDVQAINGQLYSSGIPTAGYWYIGSTVYNNAPASGGNIGWVCTASGTPGTWKAFGSIA